MFVYAKNMLQASKPVCAYNLHCMLNLCFKPAQAWNPNIADIFWNHQELWDQMLEQSGFKIKKSKPKPELT